MILKSWTLIKFDLDLKFAANDHDPKLSRHISSYPCHRTCGMNQRWADCFLFFLNNFICSLLIKSSKVWGSSLVIQHALKKFLAIKLQLAPYSCSNLYWITSNCSSPTVPLFTFLRRLHDGIEANQLAHMSNEVHA